MSLGEGGGGKTNEWHHLVNQSSMEKSLFNFSVKICAIIAGVNHTCAYNHLLRKFLPLHMEHGKFKCN